jgi:hypothetical protein
LLRVDAVTGPKCPPNRTSAQVRSGPLWKCRNGFDLKWKVRWVLSLVALAVDLTK